MQKYQPTKNGFFISTDKTLLDIDMIHRFLHGESYWAKNIPLKIVRRSIKGSLCFGVYTKRHKQIGFARVITDKATFGYIADVFILSEYRGKGLGKWMMEEILQHPELQNFRSWHLGTKDAHTLYNKFGFESVGNSERMMRKQGILNY